MFDLFRSRDKAVRIMLGGLLGLVALSMITYLIPSSGQGAAGAQQLYAEVGKDKITVQEARKAIGNLTRNRQMPAELLGIYAPQVLDQLVMERSLAREAQKLGIQVSDEEVDNAIMDQVPPQFVKDGKVDVNMLNAMLAEQGANLTMMRADMAKQIAVNKLRQIVSQGVIVSPREVENEYRHRTEKIKVQYAVIPPSKFQALAEPTDAEMQKYFASARSQYSIPEKRSLAIIVLDPEKLASSINVTEEDMKKRYTADQEKYRIGERVHVRHILLKSDASNDAKIKTKAEDLLKQIKAGGDFAELAKKNSEDPGSAVKGGDLDWIIKGQTVPEFEKSAFSLKINEVSGLVKTMYGYHILQVLAKEEAHLKPFDEVKAQIAADMRKSAGNALLQQAADKALAELRKDPLHPEKAAAAVGTVPVFAANVQAGDPIPQIGVAKEFDDATGGLRKGEVTAGPIVLKDGKVVIASAIDYSPAHPANLDEVKGQVKNKVQEQKLSSILNDKAQQFFNEVKANGGDLEKAAKAAGYEVKTSADVDRNAAIEGLGTANIIDDAFSKPVGGVAGPFAAQGSRFVVKVISKTEPDLSALALQSQTIRDDLKQKKSQERGTLFETGLMDRLQKAGELKINKDVRELLLSSYRSR